MKIDPRYIGARLDVYAAERENITRSAVQKLIENGGITVSGRTVPKNYRLRDGDEVEIRLPEAKELENVEAENIPLDIVYEDDCLIVLNKPKGMVVHPAPGNPDGTLVNALLYHCKGSLSGINGVIRPGIVHRIDKDTSGLLVVAKTDEAHLSLSEQISSHSFERLYNAIINGSLKEDAGMVDKPIGRNPYDRKKMAVVSCGRDAVTFYRVIEQLERSQLIELRLKTGRTHQIRVHMASLGHPLLGDTVYGGGRTPFEKANEKLLNGQCLHARTISFIHPKTGELMRFESPLPDYFETILGKLRIK